MDKKSWTNVDDIMKDLRMPLRTSKSLDPTYIVSGIKPPRNLTGTEETEEDYIAHGAAGDMVSTPDLDLIKHMLDLVNEEEKQRIALNFSKKDEIIEISKVNFCKTVNSIENKASSECLLVDKGAVIPRKKEKKPRHARNAAVSSIMANMSEIERQDIINDKTHLIHNIQQKTLQTTKQLNPTSSFTALSPINMFKSKKKPCLSPDKLGPDSESVKSVKSHTSSPSSSNAYVPSTYAQEKYKEYVNRSSKKDKDVVVEKYWGDLILEQMKELDAKRSLYSDDIDRTNHPQLTDEQFKRLKPVLLPMHRHHITDDCVVCIVKSEKEPGLRKMVTSTPELLSD